MCNQTETKREIFADLMEGISAMGKCRQNKVTLRIHSQQKAIVDESKKIENRESTFLRETEN